MTREPLHPALRRKTFVTAIAASVALVLAAVALSACGGGATDATGAEVSGAESFSPDAGKPTAGGTIHYAHEQEPPCLTGGWVQEAFIERQYADSLVSQTKSGKIVPWLAQSWQSSPDHLTWTFKLKPGVEFSNGEALDAKAVAENFYAWLDPDTINPTVASYIGEYFESARAVDPTTVEVKLKKPYAPLLSSLSQGYFGILAPTTIKGGADVICNEPIGSGPFVVDKWAHGQNLTLVKNPDYSSAPANAQHQGPAYVDKIIWSFVPDSTSRYGSLTTGQSDVIYDVPAQDWATAQASYEVQQYITPGRPDTLDLNTTHGVFTDQKVREAFAYAADRKAAVESAFQGKTPYNGNGALSQSTPDFDSSLEDTWPYDPEKAAQLLDQAGWKTGSDGIREKDGQKLTVKLIYGAGSILTDEGATVLQDLQAQWKEAGSDVELKPLTFSQLFTAEYTKPTSYDATIGYWTSPTAGVMLIVWRPWNGKEPNAYNNPFYNDPKLIDHIEKANASFDPKVQQAEYSAAQQIVTKQKAAVVGVYVQETSLAIDPDLKDVWLEASQGEPVFSDAYFAGGSGA